MIPFSCSCGKRGLLKDEYAGKKVKCPGCGAGVQLPDMVPQEEKTSASSEIDQLSEKIRTFLREKMKVVVDGTADIPKLDAFLLEMFRKTSLSATDRLRYGGMAAQVSCWAFVKEGLAIWDGSAQEPVVGFPKNGVAFRVREVAETFAAGDKSPSELLEIVKGFSGQALPPRVSRESALREVKVLAEKCIRIRKETLEMLGSEPPPLDYTARSLLAVDETIKDCWPNGPPTMLEEMVESYGAYVGEVIVRTVKGAAWHFPSEGDSDAHRLQGGRLNLDIQVKVTTGKHAGGEYMICPFNWLYKRFTDGEGDSIAFKYSVLLKQCFGT